MHSSAPFLTSLLCSTTDHAAAGWCVPGDGERSDGCKVLWVAEKQHNHSGSSTHLCWLKTHKISLIQRMNKCKRPKCAFAHYRQTDKAKFLCSAAADPGCLPTSLRGDSHLPLTFGSKMEGGSFYLGQTGRFHLKMRTKKLQDFVESN